MGSGLIYEWGRDLALTAHTMQGRKVQTLSISEGFLEK
jgi:hypothetical protein